jgi:hypothetical protein
MSQRLTKNVSAAQAKNLGIAVPADTLLANFKPLMVSLMKVSPLFEQHRLVLLLEIAHIKSSPPADERSVLIKSIERANRYIMLQPNVAGLGINLNAIIADLTERRQR